MLNSACNLIPEEAILKRIVEMSHASLNVISLEFFQLYDSLAQDASRVEESTTALERAKSERDVIQSELARQQDDLQKIRAFIKEQQDRIHLITTHWFFGTTLFQVSFF
jgi:predicted nuclease with TOPRIM domain